VFFQDHPSEWQEFRNLAPTIANKGKLHWKKLDDWFALCGLLPRTGDAKWRLKGSDPFWLHRWDHNSAPFFTSTLAGGEPSLWLLQWSHDAARLLSAPGGSSLTFQQLLERQDRTERDLQASAALMRRGAAAVFEPDLPSTFERDCRWLASYLFGSTYENIASASVEKKTSQTVEKAVRRVAELIRLPLPARQGRPQKKQ
jgi:hypothetical protein